MLKIVKINGIGFLCLLLFVSGCIETSTRYHGNLVPADRVVSIPTSGAHKGYWQTFDITINYDFAREGDDLKIVGQAVLGDHQQMNYDRLRFLDVFIFFLDENSRVLETNFLARSGSSNPEAVFGFARDYKVPEGTKAIAFGYDGKVYERDSIMTFYKLPLSKE